MSSSVFMGNGISSLNKRYKFSSFLSIPQLILYLSQIFYTPKFAISRLELGVGRSFNKEKSVNKIPFSTFREPLCIYVSFGKLLRIASKVGNLYSIVVVWESIAWFIIILFI